MHSDILHPSKQLHSALPGAATNEEAVQNKSRGVIQPAEPPIDNTETLACRNKAESKPKHGVSLDLQMISMKNFNFN